MCAVSYPDGDGIVFLVEDREVRVEGDLELIGSLVALCDGRLTVAQIANRVPAAAGNVRELVGALHEQGVVLDCTQAWRRFHEQSSDRAPLSRAVTSELAHQLLDSASRPAAEPLRSVRVEAGPTALGKLAAVRRSAAAADEPRPVAFAELATVLDLMYASPDEGGRPVPSGGALYPLLLHVLLRAPLAPLEPGVWWYDAEAGRLALLDPNPPATYDVFLEDNTCEALLAREQPVVFVSADVARSSRMYSNRAYRFALIEAGAVMQNAYLACAELGLPIRAAAGFDERAAGARLRLGDGSVPLLSLLLGT